MMGKPLRAKQKQRLSARINECGSIIVLKSGKVYADTKEMRSKQYGNGYVVTANDFVEIPYTCWEMSAKARKRIAKCAEKDRRVIESTLLRQPDAPVKLENRAQMFREGQGKRCSKKPSRSGSLRVNAPLRGMGLNRGDVRRNRPDFIDYITYIKR